MVKLEMVKMVLCGVSGLDDGDCVIEFVGEVLEKFMEIVNDVDVDEVSV